MMVMMNLKLNACHVYNLTLWSVLIIIFCDMQFEETKYQSYMWYLMIEHVKLDNVAQLHFYGHITNFVHTV